MGLLRTWLARRRLRQVNLVETLDVRNAPVPPRYFPGDPWFCKEHDAVGDYAIGSSKWPGLSKLIEEMGEVQQVAGKIIATDGEVQHWDGTNLKERMELELGDLLAAIQFFATANTLSWHSINVQVESKLRLFHKWHEESK